MTKINGTTQYTNGHGKKTILLNAFDMSTVGHLSPGQWKVCGPPPVYLFQALRRRLTRVEPRGPFGY